MQLVALADFTVDTVTNELIFSVGHGRYTDSRVRVASSGSLPAPLAPNTTYWVTVTSATRFTVSLTKGGAAIDLTSSGSGTHTAVIETDSLVQSGDGKGASVLPPGLPRFLAVIDWTAVLGARDNTEGSPDPPSLRMNTKGRFRFRWTVIGGGARTVSVNVKQPINLSPRPTLTVKANPAIGVAADVSGTAPSGTSWVTIGPVVINPTIDGSLFVELSANYDGQYVPCWWDEIVTT